MVWRTGVVDRPSAYAGGTLKPVIRTAHFRPTVGPLLAGRSHREPPGDGPLCATLLTLVGGTNRSELVSGLDRIH